MNPVLDFSSGVPIYRQIMGQMKYRVVSGHLKPGDRIDSIRELSVELKVNPTTVMKAYTELTREGVIFQRRGQGCFICDSVSRFSDAERLRIIDEKARALVVEAMHLGFSENEIIEQVKQVTAKINRGE
jgi:GntR family transcriptional regulator